ncbi:hypothetical protein [Butyricicoccus intestinisimiae]|uniref:HTH cro/C1-type domain-containing protein n=1 Tax=Butyricicoccus intestinisimiae TaxID=2841509 RepID=A0ABS6ERT8_9FIRM|nr:hypothetical protein [Butyricicoccus intestinisimiae]MBU5489806.1 hypothetical protein [Butyricicoccus intestinisimiae]
MKMNKEKYTLACARACLNTADVLERSGISRSTLHSALCRNSASPATVGKIARALGVDVLDILDDDAKAVEA